MACCPYCFVSRDGGPLVPLICTFAFSGSEFYCLDCGGCFGWLEPHGAESTPELDARYEELEAEWNEHAGRKLIGGGAMFTDCAACKAANEPHMRHATEAEKQTHRNALAWLTARSTEKEEPREPTDDEIYNRAGVEGGIGYSLADDSPGSLGEHDWRL